MTQADATSSDYVAQHPGALIDVGGQELFVRSIAPTGPNPAPAVFIHGLGGSATNWTDLMDLLATELDSVAPDLPGFGHSPPPPDGDYRLTAHAHAVAMLVRTRFGGQPVHVFGNSLGGATAVQFAARYPELIRSLTLVSPAMPEYAPRLSNIHMPLTAVPGVGERLWQRLQTKDVAWRGERSLDICYANMDRVDPRRMAEAVVDAKARERLPHATEAMLASLRGLISTYFDRSEQRPWKLAETIKVPVLLIYGRDDKLVNPKAAHRATKAFPNSRVVVVPDSGHVTQMEHPEVVASAWHQMAESIAAS